MMKILIYAPGMKFDGGGPGTHIRELASNLSKLGEEVKVIASLSNDNYKSDVAVTPVGRSRWLRIPLVGGRSRELVIESGIAI